MNIIMIFKLKKYLIHAYKRKKMCRGYSYIVFKHNFKILTINTVDLYYTFLTIFFFNWNSDTYMHHMSNGVTLKIYQRTKIHLPCNVNPCFHSQPPDSFFNLIPFHLYKKNAHNELKTRMCLKGNHAQLSLYFLVQWPTKSG